MAQLIMNWENDNVEAKEPALPAGIEVKIFPKLENALAAWQDIVRYLDENGQLDTSGEYYKIAMLDYPNYEDELCYFLLVQGEPAATLTVICDYEKKQGYIHMVACKPEFRGRGLGRLLNEIAVYTLKEKKMNTAYLTTDDWRIPAIKSYLRAGFFPDLETEADFKERWEKIYTSLGI